MKLSRDAVKFSRHATQRLLEMGVEANEITDCLTNPEYIVESTRYPGKFNYRRGRLTLGVAVEDDVVTVITAVWSSHEAWVEDLVRGGLTDRKIREKFGVPA